MYFVYGPFYGDLVRSSAVTQQAILTASVNKEFYVIYMEYISFFNEFSMQCQF